MVLSSFARYRSTITPGSYHLVIYLNYKYNLTRDLLVSPLSTLRSQTHLSFTLGRFGACKALVIQDYRLFAL